MSILKKSVQALKNSMHLLVFINLVFAATTFSLLYFTGRRIQSYVLMIYSYAPALQELESILSEDVSLADLNKLNEALAVINQSYKMILIITISSMVIFFLAWCFFQGLEWKMAYSSLKKKIRLDELFDKNYLNYVLRFGLVTLPAFIILFPSFYFFMAQARTFLLSVIVSMYNLVETAGEVSYSTMVLLFLIILFTSYFTIITYVSLNKYKLLESVKKSFITGIKRIHVLLPVHLICLLIIIPILYLDSYLIKFLDFKITAILSLLLYFAVISYYQLLMVSLLEKE